MFHCTQCGKCCEQVGKLDLYKHLDRGDGICRYYEAQTKLCGIYEKRPIECNVDVFYETFLTGIISKEEYYETNYEACKILKGDT